MSTPAVAVQIIGSNEAGPAILEVNAQLEQMGAAAQAMAIKMQEAGAASKFSMMEAKGTIALVGEEIGVHIPRHIRGFIASMPGVGKALEAAFSVTAGLVLIDVLVKAAEKVYEFYQALNVLSESERKANEEAIKSAKEELDLSSKRLEAEYAIKIAKAEGLEKDRLKLEMQTALVRLNSDYVGTLTEQRDKVAALVAEEQKRADALAAQASAYKGLGDSGDRAAKGMMAFTAIIDAKKAAGGKEYLDSLQKNVDLATIALQQAQAKQIDDQKKYGKAGVDQAIASGEARLAAEKTTGDAEVDLSIATARLLYAQGVLSDQQAAQQITEANDRKYQLEVKYLTKKRALLAADPTKNVGALRQLDAQLEAVEKEHLAKNLNDFAETMEKIKALQKEAATEEPAALLDANLKPYDALVKAYDQIGVKSSDFYAHQVDVAREAYATISAAGTASYGDILLSQIALAQAEENYAQSVGEDWSAQAAQITQLQKAYDEFTGKVQDGGASLDSIGKTLSRDFGSFFASLSTGTKGAASAFQSLAHSILQALDQMIAKMIMTWIVGKVIGLFRTSGLPSSLSLGTQINQGMQVAAEGVIPGHAAGGYMGAGSPGIVGERGPELWIPSSSGTVIPNSALGGAAGNQLTMHVDLRGSSLTRQEVAMALKQAMAQTKLETMFAVRDLQLRRA